MSSNPFTTFFQSFQAGVQTSTQNNAGMWQGVAAYWQTVASIMATRGNAVTTLCANTPEQLAKLAACTTPTQALECLMKWNAQTCGALWNLDTSTNYQRMHLLNTWKAMANRNQPSSATLFTAVQTPQNYNDNNNNTSSTPSSTQQASSQPASQAAVKPWPVFLAGTFITGPKAAAAPSVSVAAVPAVQVANTPAPTTTTTSNVVDITGQTSSTQTSFARTSTAAAQVISATTRRSVLARHASKTRRTAGGR
jgi:hypothetical protein